MNKTQEALKALSLHPNRRLTRRHLRQVASEFLTGKASTPQIAAFLMAMRMAGETGHEIEAFVEIMLENATKFPLPDFDEPVVDTCGTGGDGTGTFNVSTAAAFILAAAGLKVAKHGNRSASSACGSADVLEELGYPIEKSPARAAQDLADHNFCFLFARQYHPSMRHAAEARAELKVRTLFNLCGPLSNPARPTHQLIGVASADLVEPMAQGLRLLGSLGALIVHGGDGMDEVSLSQVTEGIHLDANGQMHSWHISPLDIGLEPVEMADLVGGDRATNAAIVRRILSGSKGPHSDIANLNAASVYWVAGKAPSMRDALEHIRRVQQSGEPFEVLQRVCGSGVA